MADFLHFQTDRCMINAGKCAAFKLWASILLDAYNTTQSLTYSLMQYLHCTGYLLYCLRSRIPKYNLIHNQNINDIKQCSLIIWNLKSLVEYTSQSLHIVLRQHKDDECGVLDISSKSLGCNFSTLWNNGITHHYVVPGINSSHSYLGALMWEM